MADGQQPTGGEIRYADFESLVRRLEQEVPAQFLEGVEGIEVSRKTVPHPEHADVYTMGECIPLPSEGGAGSQAIHSRVVLYHGSFLALAHLAEPFDWRAEAWDTLTHELRHHLEWRAHAPDLEAFDWAAEQNFARGDGEQFDPDFSLSAEAVAIGVTRIDDDYFLNMEVPGVPVEVRFAWHGTAYVAPVPSEARLPAFLTVAGIGEPPPGGLILVLRERRVLWQLFRRSGKAFVGRVAARPALGGSGLSFPPRA